MSLGDVCDKLKNPESRIKYGIELFSAFKPMLLERCKIEETGRFFTGQESYYIQTKHDGERFQIHMGNGRFKYFSRNAYDFTETYGESESASESLKHNDQFKRACYEPRLYLSRRFVNWQNHEFAELLLSLFYHRWRDDGLA